MADPDAVEPTTASGVSSDEGEVLARDTSWGCTSDEVESAVVEALDDSVLAELVAASRRIANGSLGAGSADVPVVADWAN
jgi:hypothetical protein